MTTANARETAAKKDVLKLQRAIVDGLEDVKAQDIQVFNTEHLSPLFERVIVASGTSNRQTKALAASVRDAVRDAGFPKPRVEGEDNGEWIIVDCGSAVAHIMQPAIRQYYHLEEIWGDTPVRLKLGAPKPVSAAAEPVAVAAKKAAAKKAPAKTGGRSAAGKSASAKTPARKAKPVVPEVEYAPERPVIEPEKKPRFSSRTAGTGTAAKKPSAKAPAAKKTTTSVAAKSPARKAPAVKVAAKTLVVGKKPPAKKAAAKAAPRRS